MKIKDGRGEYRSKIGANNKQRIIEWFLDNPNSTQNECAVALNLTRVTVWKHLKSIREEPVE